MKLVPIDFPENENNLSDLAKMLPERYQKRGKQILQLLDGKTELDESNRVIYEDSTGSHVVDLVRYFVVPKHLKIQRPRDAPKFAAILRSLNIPTSLLGRPLEDEPKRWTSFR